MSNQGFSVKLKMSKSDLLKSLNVQREFYLDEITSCQSELDLLSEKQYEEKLKTSKQFDDLKKPHLDRRTKLIRTIPNFWINAIESHPQLCLLLDSEVTDVFRYLTKIEAEEDEDHELGMNFKLNFYFEVNPYIENDRLTKELSLLKTKEEISSSSTAIIWNTNYRRAGLNEEAGCSGDSCARESKNFFDWFSDNENPEDEIFMYFQAICENPLAYSSFFYEEDIEESSDRACADDHKSTALLKGVGDLNLNDDKDDQMNVD